MENGAIYNLIFMDIEFAKNAINGVEVGRLIRGAYCAILDRRTM